MVEITQKMQSLAQATTKTPRKRLTRKMFSATIIKSMAHMQENFTLRKFQEKTKMKLNLQREMEVTLMIPF
jgi:hypothetical protein